MRHTTSARPRPRRLACTLALCIALGLLGLAAPATGQDATPDQLLQPDLATFTPARAMAPVAAPADSAESLPALLGRVLARDPQVRVAASLLQADRKSTRLNSSHPRLSRMPSSA